MDNTAIKQIQETSGIPELIIDLGDNKTHIPTMIAPEGFEIHNLEKYMKNRSSYRVNFKTSSIEAFIRYCENFDDVGVFCFVGPRMNALTMFDLGTLEEPGHQKHNGSLNLDQTTAYQTLLRLNELKLDQKTAAEFIEDWSDQLIIYSESGGTMTSKEAARAFRIMSIEMLRELNTSVSSYSASQTSIEKIEANKADLLPGELIFECEPYLHFAPRKFKIRVSINTGDKEPKLVFRIVHLESIKEEITEEFVTKLELAFESTEIRTYIGEI